jgi:methyl-accepting chemotaxis protein
MPGESDGIGEKFASIRRTVTPEFIQRRYAAKFAISILVVVVIIGSIGAISYFDVRDLTRQDAVAQVSSTGATQADSINEWVVSMRVQTKMISDSNFENTEQKAAIDSTLRDSLNQATPSVTQIYYVDTSTNTIVAGQSRTSTGSIEGKQVSEIDQPWEDPIERTSEISGVDSLVRMSRTTYTYQGEEVMAFVSPVSGSDGVIVLVGSMQDKIDGIQNTQTGYSASILTGDGTSVISGSDSTQSFDHTQTSAFKQALDDGKTGLAEDGQAVRAYAPVPEAGWVVVSTAPKSEIFAVSRTVGLNVLLTVGGGLLSLIVVGTALGRQTVVPLTRLRERAERMEEGDLAVELETKRSDEIGRLYHSFGSMRDALRAQIHNAEEAKREAERERERIEQMHETLQQRADEYADVMQRYAAGDLTSRMEPAEDNEAMAAIAEEFNEMAATIEEVVDRVSQFSAIVSASSEEVTASSQEVRTASEQVTESVQEISAGAERQHDALESVAGETERLSTTIQEIASVSDQVATLAERTVQVGQEGQRAANEAIEGMDEIEAESTAAVEEIRELEAKMDKIGEVIRFISEIAEQTNMLALNANIEASRSSGDGNDEGFGVVAEEVKELSEETKEAADEIGEHLEEIQEQSKRAAAEVEKTSEQVGQQRGAVERAVESLERIASFAKETNSGVQEISEGTRAQAESTQEVLDMVNEATAISQQTCSEAESVAAAAEEQTSSLTEVTRSAERLSQEAGELSRTVDHFETDVSGERQTGGVGDADDFSWDVDQAANEHK